MSALVNNYVESGGGETVHRVTAASMHLDSHAVAQVSALSEGDGFLIRVWGPDQVHEYGGGNLNAVSLIVRFVDDLAVLDKFDFHALWGGRVVSTSESADND